MKGAVFIAFNQMIEEQAGIDTWEQLLQDVNPASGGIYTSVEDFPDEEMFALVTRLSEITGKEVSVLVESFGSYLFDFLNSKYPMFTEAESDFFGFIKSIDGVIHKEVRKLYDNTNLPELDYEQIDSKNLNVFYQSPRKLCMLAEGLIRGAARHYQTEYTLDHCECMHKGAERCLFKIKIS